MLFFFGLNRCQTFPTIWLLRKGGDNMAGKRSNGEGSVTKRSNGTWRAQLMVGYKEDGSAKRVSFSGKTKSEVLEKLREYRNQMDSKITDAKTLTFSSWADTWYKSYRSQVQPSTYCGYQYTLKLIKAGLGDKILQNIRLMDVNAYLDTLACKKYSLSQIRKCKAMLIQIFDYAEDNNLILKNPARRAKITKLQTDNLETKEEKDAFTEEEIKTLEESLNNDLLGNSILLMLNTGLRTQELLALKKEDIAEDGSSIDVNKAIKTVKGIPTLGPPKSKKSRRRVPVPEDKRKYALFLREKGNSGLIWSPPGKDSIYGVGSFRKRYYNAIKQLPVRKLTPHCCRHTYVTRLQAKGVPMEIIAALVGHSDLKTTSNYLHTSFSTLQTAVTILNNKER